MGRIRSRALRGWRNIWGDGDNAGPLDIDGERGITPVYDVGPAAHWNSPYGDRGRGVIGRTELLAGGAQTVTFEINLLDEVALWGLSTDELADTIIWIRDASVRTPTGVTLSAPWTATVIVRPSQDSAAVTPITFRLAAAGTTQALTIWDPSGGGNDRVMFPNSPSFTNRKAVEAFPIIREPNLNVRIPVGAAVLNDLLVFSAFVWVGPDGGPPPAP